MGYSSIQIGVNLTSLKGFNSLAAQQSFWSNIERQMYTDLMEQKFDKFYSEHPQAKEADVILQTFSNNGIQTWNNVRAHLQHPKAFIFDSGPANCTFPQDFDIPGKIYRSNNPNASLSNKILVSMAGNFGYMTRFAIYPFREMDNMPEKLVPRVPELVQNSPSLILAATGDFLTPPKLMKIEEERFKAANKKVEFHILEGIHVTMLRDDRENYKNIISEFVQKYNL